MSCNVCQQAVCHCEHVPEIEVQQPAGTIVGQANAGACDTCSEGDMQPPSDDCCNLVDPADGTGGKSWVMSVGGVIVDDELVPLQLPETSGLDCPNNCPDNNCCPTLPLDLLGTACPPQPLAPGTYRVWARATVFSLVGNNSISVQGGEINSGARFAIRFLQDCADTATVLPIAEWQKPCCCESIAEDGGTPPDGYIPREVAHPEGEMLIYVPECSPAIQFLGKNGCPPCVGDNPGPSVALFAANFQLKMEFISSRDLVNCIENRGLIPNLVPRDEQCGAF